MGGPVGDNLSNKLVVTEKREDETEDKKINIADSFSDHDKLVPAPLKNKSEKEIQDNSLCVHKVKKVSPKN